MLFIAKIIFNLGSTPDQAVEVIDNLFHFYRNNGQLTGQTQIYHLDDQNRYEIFLYLPSKDALDEKWDNKYVSDAKKSLREMNVEYNATILPDKNADEKISLDHGFLVLEADPYEIISPVTYCTNNQLIHLPLYLLPKTNQNENYQDIITWQSDYRSLGQLYMNGYNDRFTRKQFVDVKSNICVRGREICQKIENLTNLETYYRININYLTQKEKNLFLKKYSFEPNNQFENYLYFSKNDRLVLG